MLFVLVADAFEEQAHGGPLAPGVDRLLDLLLDDVELDLLRGQRLIGGRGALLLDHRAAALQGVLQARGRVLRIAWRAFPNRVPAGRSGRRPAAARSRLRCRACRWRRRFRVWRRPASCAAPRLRRAWRPVGAVPARRRRRIFGTALRDGGGSRSPPGRASRLRSAALSPACGSSAAARHAACACRYSARR